MTTFTAYDENNQPIQVPGVIVSCTADGCVNAHIEYEVPDDPNGYAVCGGGCGGVLRQGANITLEPPETPGVPS